MNRRKRPVFRHTWGWPLVMALLSLLGLLAGLVGDGGWDIVSWLGLGIPTAVCLGFGWLRRG